MRSAVVAQLSRCALVFLTLACQPQKGIPHLPSTAEPQVKATVVTIRTVLLPDARTFTHSLVIAGGLARSGDELDRWRLFDLSKNEVTFVDDVARTYRRQSLASLISARHAAAAKTLPDTLAAAQLSVTNETRTLQGVAAKKSVVRMGAYQRQLWIGTHPLIPNGLFAMMEAASPVAPTSAPVMRTVDDALFDVRGYPLLEHAELPYGNDKMVLDRTVMKIEQRNVGQSWLAIRSDYKDITPASNGAGRAASGR
jgi:hypothetical protein